MSTAMFTQFVGEPQGVSPELQTHGPPITLTPMFAGQCGTHRPYSQVAVPFNGATQRLPQAPQWSVLVLQPESRVSHPSDVGLARSPLQSPQPSLHGVLQEPVAQSAPVFVLAAQATPHPPQWARLLSRVSQPFEAVSPSQSPYPSLHVRTQVPVEQSAPLVLAVGVQAALQAPQWALLLSEASQPLRSMSESQSA